MCHALVGSLLAFVAMGPSGQLPPPGFHREMVMNVPLVVGGIVLASVGTGLLASRIANAGEGDDSRESEGLSDSVVMCVGGLMLAAGVGLIVWGTLGGPTVFVPNGSVSLAPLLEHGGSGGNVMMVF